LLAATDFGRGHPDECRHLAFAVPTHVPSPAELPAAAREEAECREACLAKHRACLPGIRSLGLFDAAVDLHRAVFAAVHHQSLRAR
jgi:hypothetical protein